MNFLLSDDQQEIQEAVRRYLAKTCQSVDLHRIFDSPSGHDIALWKGLADIGVTGLALPEEAGGMGLELIDLALVAEILGAAATPGPFLGHSLAGLALAWSSNKTLARRWLPGLASGEVIGTVAFAEGASLWWPEEWQLPSAAPGLVGTKTHVPFAAAAGLIVVGTSGGQLYLVERDTPGLEISEEDSVDRTRRLGRIQFHKTPASLLAAAPDVAERLCNAARVLLAADAFGGANCCLERTVDYAKTREQFGRPIGAFQGLKHQLADLAVAIEPARGLYWYAAHAFDRIPEQASPAAALAKAHLTDRYIQVSRGSVEAHGGIGYTWDCDIQIYVKRAMFDYAFLGGAPRHRARYADLAGW